MQKNANIKIQLSLSIQQKQSKKIEVLWNPFNGNKKEYLFKGFSGDAEEWKPIIQMFGICFPNATCNLIRRTKFSRELCSLFAPEEGWNSVTHFQKMGRPCSSSCGVWYGPKKYNMGKLGYFNSYRYCYACGAAQINIPLLCLWKCRPKG